MGKHSEWRNIVKKLRRKRIRQQVAKEREENIRKDQLEKELLPGYEEWLKYEENTEKFRLEEEKRIHDEQEKQWLETERKAQEQWKQLQQKLSEIQEERARQNAKIREEWEHERKKLRELEEVKKKEVEEKARQHELLKNQIDEFITNGGEIPDQLNVVFESNPGKTTCPFFSKTSACRFRDLCSRNHVRPGISKIVLIPNFYSHYSLSQSENEHGNSSLEFENTEVEEHFMEFFLDVVPEMEKCGRIRKFIVCNNGEAHLRGNVYVEYSSKREAVRSYKTFNGRWYAGKQLNVEFCGITSWNSAICGLFYKHKCPKGSACNFIHTFHNPKNLYIGYNDRPERSPTRQKYESGRTLKREWRWSESPEHYEISDHLDWEDRLEISEEYHINKSTHIRRQNKSSNSERKLPRSSRSIRLSRSHRRSRSRSSHRSRKRERKEAQKSSRHLVKKHKSN